MSKSEIMVQLAEKLGVPVVSMQGGVGNTIYYKIYNGTAYHVETPQGGVGNTIYYKIYNGTAYHVETPKEIVDIIESARDNNRYIQLRFCFGDAETGQDWGEINNTTGYIGRSTGTIKVPLLLKSRNSSDGDALLDHCIVKIERKGQGLKKYEEVYRHTKYHK